MMRAKVVTEMRLYAQDEVNQEDSEQNEVDGMKKGAGCPMPTRYHHHAVDDDDDVCYE